MKIKVDDLIGGWQSVLQLSRTDLPVATSFRLARAMKKLEPEFEVAWAKRSELAKKYGKQVGDSDQWEITDREGFLEAYEPLGQEEIEVDIKPIPARELEKLNGDAQIKPAVLAGAWFLFDVE